MNRSPVQLLLADLATRGIELAVEGGAIRARPKGALDAELRGRVAALRAELLVELASRPDSFTGFVCDLFDGKVVDRGWRDSAPFYTEVTQPNVCRLCSGRSWWRLTAGGPVVCERCHPPCYVDGIERWTTDGGAS